MNPETSMPLPTSAATDERQAAQQQAPGTDPETLAEAEAGPAGMLAVSAKRSRLTEPFVLHMPVNIRNLSLVVLTLFASLFMLHWAKAVFIPFMLGLIFSYALSPLVDWAEARKVPRSLGAAIVLICIVASMVWVGFRLRNEAVKLVDSLPAAAQKLSEKMKSRPSDPDSTLQTVQKAAARIEQAAQDSATPITSKGAMRVVVEPARFNISNYLWTGTLGLMALIGQAAAVLFLTYFFMVAGSTFRRKLVKLAGPTLSSKRITLQALDEITVQIQRYLQVQLFTSALVGILTGAALGLMKLENAAVWGIAAAVLNMVPYVGSIITAGATALVAFLQFGSMNMAMAVGGVSLTIHTLVGNLLTPWLTSRASRMNPVAVFVALLAWGWLWGVWGLLMGIPIMLIVKTVCDRVEDLKPAGEFLGS